MTSPTKQSAPLARIEAVFGWRGFPDALFYEAEHALRFDLGGGYEDEGVAVRFPRAMARASAIAEAVFEGADSLTAVVSHYALTKAAARPDGASLRTLRELGFEGRFGPGDLEPRRDGEPAPEDPEDDIRGIWFAAEFPNASKPLAALLWATVVDEIATVSPQVPWVHRAYIVDFARGVAVHAYDDRGMDVIATDPARLAPLYTGFNDWLLDYHRARMDAQFG